MSKLYAGLGARDTPVEVVERIEALAARLAREGWVLRTGLSPGADQAFYRGAVAARGEVELYLPWPGFEKGARLASEEALVRELARPSRAAFELAAALFEGATAGLWEELSEEQRALLARDGHEVLGRSLDDPVARVICWTPDAGLEGRDPRAGGTGQALRVARDAGIDVLNLAREDHARALGAE